MLNRKSLARTSGKPGKTRQLNFYNMDDIFYFVDLPGYGYSEMSKSEQAKVGISTESYLKSRKNINLIILIVDIRHNPSENDKMMIDFIKSTRKRFIVITSKADKIAKTKVNEYVEDIAKELDVDQDLIFAHSATTKLNQEFIWNVIEESLES